MAWTVEAAGTFLSDRSAQSSVCKPRQHRAAVSKSCQLAVHINTVNTQLLKKLTSVGLKHSAIGKGKGVDAYMSRLKTNSTFTISEVAADSLTHSLLRVTGCRS